MTPPPSAYRPAEGYPTYNELKELFEESLAINNKYFKDMADYATRLEEAGNKMDAYLQRQDGTTNGMLDCRRAWHDALGK